MLAATISFLPTEHVLLIVAVCFVLLLAGRAWTHGVLKMLWAIAGIALGAASGVFFFQNANALLSRWLPGSELGFKANMAGSIIIALVAYLVFRQLSKAILQKLFNADGPLSGWAGGIRGSIVSLVPSLITVLIVGLCLRMGGTMMELRSAERICAPDSAFLKETYPGWPVTTEWRDALEKLPYVVEIYELTDPISRRPERTLVMLMIASKNGGLLRHLESHNATLPIVNGAIFQALLVDDTLHPLLNERKHVALLRHPKIAAAASNEIVAGLTHELELRPAIDSYMLSEERQQLLRSYRRPEVPTF